jgi:two-component system chemotaxis response regulator CheY
VVDDDSTISQLISEILSLDGFKDVQWASNGIEAVNQYQELMPDLVLMDISMPVMDGYEASCRIKSMDPEAKIVVLTGNPGDSRARRILSEGIAETVITKPIRLQKLLDIVRSKAAGTPAPDAPPPVFSMPQGSPPLTA